MTFVDDKFFEAGARGCVLDPGEASLLFLSFENEKNYFLPRNDKSVAFYSVCLFIHQSLRLSRDLPTPVSAFGRSTHQIPQSYQ
jgi:hypothetical protein